MATESRDERVNRLVLQHLDSIAVPSVAHLSTADLIDVARELIPAITGALHDARDRATTAEARVAELLDEKAHPGALGWGWEGHPFVRAVGQRNEAAEARIRVLDAVVQRGRELIRHCIFPRHPSDEEKAASEAARTAYDAALMEMERST